MSNASITAKSVRSSGREYPLYEPHHFYHMQGRRVAVAFNWHLKLFSIRDKPGGKVLGYTEAINLSWVDFDVDIKKAAKVYNGGQKQLHAYVVGDIQVGDMDAALGEWKWALRYNPREVPWFTTPANGEKCIGATAVSLWTEDGKARMAAYLPVR